MSFNCFNVTEFTLTPQKTSHDPENTIKGPKIPQTKPDFTSRRRPSGTAPPAARSRIRSEPDQTGAGSDQNQIGPQRTNKPLRLSFDSKLPQQICLFC